MQHKISDLTRKVSVMYDKSLLLHRMKYDTPRDQRDHVLIDNLIADIRQLAGDIFNDRETYSARSIDDDFDLAAV
jgi:hypothetical protein